MFSLFLFLGMHFFQMKHEKYEQPAAINVMSYGAKGDGVNDDTKSIQQANDIAYKQGAKLFFPSGVYLASELKPTTSWYGKAIIKRNTSFSGSFYYFCQVKHCSGLDFQDLTFDGGVEGNPIKWTSTNYNSFNGAISFFLYQSNDISFKNCKFQNAFTGNLRIENCKNITLNNCNAIKARGNYGDCYYVEQSSNISFLSCTAEDYTRIGFVVEKNSDNISFTNCTAKNGHDCSRIYGGREYNAGFWFEGSVNITVTNCSSTDNTNHGFLASALGLSADAGKEKTGVYKFTNCVSRNAKQIGFSIQSSVGSPIAATITKCKAYNSSQPFLAVARHENDSFLYINCLAQVTFSPNSANDIAYMWESSTKFKKNPTITYKDCAVAYSSEPVSGITTSASNSGDIGTYSGGNINIEVDGMTKANKGEPIVLKCLYGAPSFVIKNTIVDTTLIKRKGRIVLENSKGKKML